MINLTLLVMEILGLEILIYKISFFNVLIFFIFFGVYFWFVLKKKNIIYYVIPIIFLIRSFLVLDFSEIRENRVLNIQADIVNSIGKIEKIDNKIPLQNIYINVENISDGKYKIKGEILKTGYNFYEVKVLDKEEITPNFIEKYFYEKFNSIKKYLSNRCGNFLQGVILGERRYIYREISEQFRYSGASHLLAISGLHIGIIIGLIIWFLNLFKIKREIRDSLALVFLTVYILGISISASVIRAYVMGVIYLLGKIVYEQIDIKKSFTLAFLINLILYPNSLGNLSFLLSYMCLFSIIYIYPLCKIKNIKKYENIIKYLIFTGVIQIFITPLSMYFFGVLPLFSYFTNIFLIPFGTVFIILGFISFFIPELIFSVFISPILEITYLFMEKILYIFEKIPYLNIDFERKFDLKFIIFIYIILFVLFYKERLKRDYKKLIWEN